MPLTGKNVLIPVADGYHELEMHYPYYRLIEAGAQVFVAGPDGGDFVGKYGYKLRDVSMLEGLDPATFHGVIIPGGHAPDRLRMDEDVLEFVRTIARGDRLVAAICHGGWVLADADVVRGRRVTSYPAIRKDLERAGAKWVDEPVVVDRKLVTSRVPDDLPYFMKAIIPILQSLPD
jgi:protease I